MALTPDCIARNRAIEVVIKGVINAECFEEKPFPA